MEIELDLRHGVFHLRHPPRYSCRGLVDRGEAMTPDTIQRLRDLWMAMQRPDPRQGETPEEWIDRCIAGGKSRDCVLSWHEKCGNPEGCVCSCHPLCSMLFGDLLLELLDERDLLVAQRDRALGLLEQVADEPTTWNLERRALLAEVDATQ
jgi:hypothetical protein